MRKKRRPLRSELLESRVCMAASLGWDGPGLGSASLTYSIDSSGSNLDSATVRAAIETALKAWSDVADVQFVPTNQTGLRDSLDFTFGKIDGSGGTLAQAYLPDDLNASRIAGDVEFDSSETWEVGNDAGASAFDLVFVAVHEIGHALGLEHDEAAGSTLYPTVSPTTSFSSLPVEDVDAVLALYALATTGMVASVNNDSSVDLSDPTTTTDVTPDDTAPVTDTPEMRRRWSFQPRFVPVNPFTRFYTPDTTTNDDPSDDGDMNAEPIHRPQFVGNFSFNRFRGGRR